MILKFTIALHVFVALFMILVVLLQNGNSGGIGATFGGGNSSGVFGATGATSIFAKLTYVAAAIFMCTSLSLSLMQSRAGSVGIFDKVKETSSETTTTNGALDHLDPTKPQSTQDALPSEQKASEAKPAETQDSSATNAQSTKQDEAKKETSSPKASD